MVVAMMRPSFVICGIWIFASSCFCRNISIDSVGVDTNVDNEFDSKTDSNEERPVDDSLSVNDAEERKKSKISKRILKERENSLEADLVLVKFPPQLTKETVLKLMQKHFGHLISPEMMQDIANGKVTEIPSTWSFIKKLDWKGAIIGALAKHFLANYNTIKNDAVEVGLSKKECKKRCKKTESRLDSFITSNWSYIMKREFPNEDMRIRIRPSDKKYYNYESKDEETTCICVNVKKNVYVSPALMKLIDEHFFKNNNVEELLDEVFKNDPILENTENSTWGFGSIKDLTLEYIGFGGSSNSSRSKRLTEKKIDKHNARKFLHFILAHAVLNFFLLSFCPCIWPCHTLFVIMALIFWI